MTTRVRTLDFLPEIFKTKANEQFLSSTLDVLTSQPNLSKLQGFIGSKFGYGVKSSDSYLTEPTKVRSNYQLEPSVVFKKKDTNVPVDLVAYPGLVDLLRLADSNVDNNSNLFRNEYYSWDSFIDLDKLVNYSQYYWLPEGPEPLTVTNIELNKKLTYVVNSSPFSYSFTAKTVKVGEDNPELTLVRGGTYLFVVDQDTPFYLQTMPDITGYYPSKTNVSLRDIWGVENNGAKTGTIKFTVPSATAQEEWMFTGYNPVDLATTLPFESIHNSPVGLVSIDGVSDLNGKTIMFIDSVPGKHTLASAMFDSQGHDFDVDPFENSYDTQLNSRFYKVRYFGDDTNGYFMELIEDASIPNNQNINVQLGTQYSGRTFVKNAYGEILLVPPVTAPLDTLYYRDGVIEDKIGKINIVDYIDSEYINVNDIIGKQTYISPNGIKFTNGLRVQFAGNIFPKEYEDGTYYVEGVGTSIQLVPASELTVPESYSQSKDSPFDGQYFDILAYGSTDFFPKDKDYITISRNAVNKNAWSRSNRWFHVDVLKTVLAHSPESSIVLSALGNPSVMAKRPIIEFYPNLRLFNSGVTSKNNISYINFSDTDAINKVGSSLYYTPDGDTSFLYDGARVIFAGDNDINIRNKIFVVKLAETIKTANLNITSCSVDQSSGSTLVTFGFDALDTAIPVNKLITIYNNLNISFNGTHKVVSSTASSITLLYPDGVIGSWDLPIDFEEGDTAPEPTVSSFKTNMEATLSVAHDGANIQYLDQVTVVSGASYGGKTFYFDGSSWLQSQQKTRVNQPPLFDLFDNSGHSLSDFDFYPGSDFAGTTLFEYATGSGPDDTELHIPVKYNSVDNIGDIVFNTPLYTATFNYGFNNQAKTSPISMGYVHSQTSATDVTRLLGWVPAVEESFQYQILTFSYTGVPYSPKFVCDVAAKDQTSFKLPVLVVYVNNSRIGATDYTFSTTADTTTVTLLDVPEIGTEITIMIYSDQVSTAGYYQIPSNLSNNPFNAQTDVLSLGDIRGHYKSIFNNVPNITGDAFGPNNYRDLGDVTAYGTRIVQHSAALPLTAMFMKDGDTNFISALNFNRDEYANYKNLLINTITNNDFDYIQTDALLLDEVIAIISAPKTETNSFFWSDMVPTKTVSKSTTHKITHSTYNSTFQLSKEYDFSKANYSSVLVYLTRTVNFVTTTSQLLRGIDYQVNGSEVAILFELTPTDVILINEYDQTYGSFAPNTPTKLGLYPAFIPEVIFDDSYSNPTYFIKGHDGSYFKLYGDFVDGVLTDVRDKIILEFEKRVYNNLKLSNPIPVTAGDVMPGFFRDVGLSYTQTREIYETQFLNWVGQNRIDYTNQVYSSTDEFSWNYSDSTLTLTNETIQPGNWRGIYMWLYDTSTPHKTPWEMLGLVNKPTWWDSHYGEAPYTSDNLVLWTDISNGYVWNNGDGYVNPSRIRTGLLDILPVDTAGNLKSPFTNCIRIYDVTKFNRPWKSGDYGPAEYAYSKSSMWPFDLMQLMTLTRPAKFFGLCVDVDSYSYNDEFKQYLFNNRLRSQLKDIAVYGTDGTTAKHSYLNWIVDYATQFGVDGTTTIANLLNNVDVRLSYRVAGFTDKDMIKFYTENSPTTSTGSMLIPDESYAILLHNNPPTESIIFSSVVVQRTANGYSVYGNKQTKAFFTTYTPIAGLYEQVTVNTLTVNVAKNYYSKKTRIPYGTEFTTLQSLLEFLKGYGLFLESQGMIFDDIENGVELTWDQMLAEVVYWAQTGWEVGSTVNVNPSANMIKVNRQDAVVQPLTLQKQNFVLNQNLIPIQLNDLSIYRYDSEFSVKGLNSGDSLSYFNGTLSTFEHVVIFDNKTVFGDLLYKPNTGLRQQRMYVRGTKTAEWKGTITTDGFILCQDNIEDWVPNKKYAKGTVVTFKGEYYMANSTVVKPSNTFTYTDWLKTSYEMVQQRMVPNSSTRSAESLYFYDKTRPNLANDADLLSFSLIGYRPRDYLVNADLADASQVNIYSELIGSKGTKNAISGLDGINLKTDKVQYTTHENWAIKNSEFGGVLNQNFVQFNLDENKLTGTPSIVSLIRNSKVDGAQQQVSLNKVTNYGRTLSTENVLPQVDSISEVFSSAGYVNLDDVIELGYNINSLSDAGIAAIYRNDYIWVANHNNAWDVYTPVVIDATAIAVSDNLNSTATIAFNKPHTLLKGQSFGLINFNSEVNGFHTVLEVVSVNSLVVSLTLSTPAATIAGSGIVYLLQSQRVRTPRDIPNLPLLNTEYDTTKVWVDQAKDGNWAVYEKTNNYVSTQVYYAFETGNLGKSVEVVPGYGYFAGDPELGEVSQFISLNDDGRYLKKSTISKPGTNYGTTIAHSSDIMVVSAPTDIISSLYIYRLPTTQTVPVLEQTINIAGGFMGKAIAISGDGQYIYTSVSDETSEAVFLFSRENQPLKTSSGVLLSQNTEIYQKQFKCSGNVASNIKEGQCVTFVTSYASVGTLVANFTGTQTDAFTGSRPSFKLAGNVGNLLSSGDTVTFTNTTVEKNRLFTIVNSSYDSVNNQTLFYVDEQPVYWESPSFAEITSGSTAYKVTFSDDAVYTVITGKYDSTSNTTTFFTVEEFAHSISSNTEVYISSINYELTEVISPVANADTPALAWTYGDEYGAGIATNYDGSKLFVTAPKHSYSGQLSATGQFYAYDKLSETWEVQRDQKPNEFYVVRLPWYPSISSKVYVNGKRLKANQYVLILNAVIIGSMGLVAGDLITLNSDNMVLTGTYLNEDVTDMVSNQQFGASIACNKEGSEIIVGAPNAVYGKNEGAVYRYTDAGKRFGAMVGTIPAALTEPTYMLINGYRVNLLKECALLSTVSVGATSAFISVQEASQLPEYGVIGFRNAATGQTENSVYVVNKETGELKFQAYNDAGDLEDFPFEGTGSYSPATTQVYAPLGSAINIANEINKQNITNIFAYETDGRLVIRLRDLSLAPSFNKLSISVFNGNYLTMLGFLAYPKTQTIRCPHEEQQTLFGAAVAFSDENSFVIGAPKASSFINTKIDFSDDSNIHNDTVIDNNLTVLEDRNYKAGAVYMYDYIDSYEEALDNVGKYVYSQSCNALWSDEKDIGYGSALSFKNNTVLVGSPASTSNTGKLSIHRNYKETPNWTVLRKSDQVVNIDKINKVQLFNDKTGITETSLDYIDPLQGKLLGAVQSNLDYIASSDPAAYNSVGYTTGNMVWNKTQLGQMWFDTSRVKFLNYHQNDVVYNSKYWGEVFPGSDVAIYTWIESSTPPATYTGAGTPYDFLKYTVTFITDTTNALVPKYYFWVRDTDMLNAHQDKTLSDMAIARYISKPKDSGVAYFAPLRSNTFGLFNAGEYINGQDTVMHIGYSSTVNDSASHSDYKLIRTNSPADFLPGFVNLEKGYTMPVGLYSKYVDSFVGEDTNGAIVPDISLPTKMQIGISLRPRQSMFVNRLEALKNFIQYTNSILIQHPVMEYGNATLLSASGDTFDTTLYWTPVYWWKEGYSELNRPAASVDMISDLPKLMAKENMIVSVAKNADGNREVYAYLSGEWTRVGVENGTLQFSSQLWEYNNNNIGFGNDFYDLSSYDSHPAQETRNIIRAINEQLFTGPLLEYRNKSLIMMFEFIQSENIESLNYLPWLSKTSLVDVNCIARDLSQITKYTVEDISILEGYINEVKPYHVVIKEFLSRYTVSETVGNTITDFDLPAYYDSSLQKYVTPQLVFGNAATQEQFNIEDAIWADANHNPWSVNFGVAITDEHVQMISTLKSFINPTSTSLVVSNPNGLPVQGVLQLNDEQIAYTRVNRITGELSGVTRGVNQTTAASYVSGTPIYIVLSGVTVLDSGYNYIDAPEVTAYIDTSIYPEPRRPAVLSAIMNNDRVVGVKVIDQGEGYTITPEIVFENSFSYTFDNLDSTDTNSSTLINIDLDELFISSEMLIKTGDVVKVQSVSDSSINVIPDGYYYVNVKTNINGNYVSFYRSYSDAVLKLARVQFLTPTTTSYEMIVGVCARAVVNVANTAVRGISTTLKFDRVTYKSKIVPWTPNTPWASLYQSVGNDASSSLDSSDSTIKSSREGAILPITGVTDDDGKVVVTVDYDYSGMTPGHLDNANLYFFKVTAPIVPEITNGTDGKALIEIFRPAFTYQQISPGYTMNVLQPGSIYSDNYTIIVKGSALGGVDDINDATIFVRWVDATNGIYIASISGVAVPEFNRFYVKPKDATSLYVYTEPSLHVRANYDDFIWTGALTDLDNYGVVGSDYAYLPEPIANDYTYSHQLVSLVSYAGYIWACKESNSDSEFDPSKWTYVRSNDLSLTALDRIEGYYSPTVGMPPKDASVLTTGTTYPNTVYYGNSFAPGEELPLDIILNDNEFTLNTSDVKGVVHNGTTTVIVTESSKGVFVFVRNENLTWDTVPLSKDPLTVTGFAYMNETYVVSTASPTTPLFVSFDAKKWITLGKETTFDSIDYDDGSFDSSTLSVIAAAFDNVSVANNVLFATNRGIHRSTDGLIWTEVFTFSNPLPASIKKVAYLNSNAASTYIAVGSAFTITDGFDTPYPTGDMYSKIILSSDGVEWATLEPSTALLKPLSVAASNELAVIVGGDGLLMYSHNGSNWVLGSVSGSISGDIVDVAYGNGMFMAIGEQNNSGATLILTSADGTTWTPHYNVELLAEEVNSIYFDGDNFNITGLNGTLVQTTNGINLDNILNIKSEDPTYIVKGSEFLYGYGPEEMIPGIVTDSLCFKVKTAPGAYWNRDGGDEFWYLGSGFNMAQLNATVQDGIVDFDELVGNGIGLSLFVVEAGRMIRIYENSSANYLGITFTVNWNTKKIEFNNAATDGMQVFIEAYEVGNGVEITRSNTENMPLINDDETGHSSIITDVEYTSQLIEPAVYAYTPATGIKKLQYPTEYWFTQAVSDDENLNGKLKIVFDTTYDQDTDYIVYSILRSGKTPNNHVEHDYSAPETELFTGLSGTGDLITMSWKPAGNEFNAIVERDGLRLTPEVDYIISTENDEFTINFMVELTTDNVIAVTTFNCLSRQFMMTVSDTSISDSSGYSITMPNPEVPFPMGDMYYTNGSRTWVTINGKRIDSSLLAFGNNNELTINAEIAAGDIIVVTAMVSSASPNETHFVVNVDKSGTQHIFRNNSEDSTWLTQTFEESHDTIYVRDASYLVEFVPSFSTVETTADGVKFAYLNNRYTSISGAIVQDLNTGSAVDKENITVTIVNGRYAVVITDETVSDGDSVQITSLVGDVVFINNERIHFTTVDLDNNTLSGLTRSILGTQLKEIHPIYSKLCGVSPGKVLDPKHLSNTWTDFVNQEGVIYEIPLQLSTNEAARFLQLSNI